MDWAPFRRKRPDLPTLAGLGVCLLYTLLLGGLYAFYQTLPDPYHLSSLDDDPLPTSRIVASDDSTLMTDRPFLHMPVPLEEISPILQSAVLIALDPESVGTDRADPSRVLNASFQGAKPPLSLRLVRFQTGEPHHANLLNRLQQALLAIRLENNLGRESLLELYLNRIYLGEGAYGVEAASQIYFAKHATELDAGEAALLAGLIADPDHDNPYFDPQRAVNRRDAILLALKKSGRLPSATLNMYLGTPLPRTSPGRVLSNTDKAPWFNRIVLSQALTLLHIDAATFWKQGYQVKTTLDLEAQRSAESWLHRFPENSAALISLGPDNGVIAYSSNRLMLPGVPDCTDPLRARQPMGALIRPLIYASALQQGANIHTRYDGLTLPQALITEKPDLDATVMKASGVERIIQAGHLLGLPLPTLPEKQLSAGGMNASLMDVSAAYSTFRNNGNYVAPYVISQITDRNGKVIYQHRTHDQPVLSRKARDTVVALLRGAILHRKPNVSNWPWAFAGQARSATGSDQTWFVGFTPEVTTGIMIAGASAEQSLSHWQSLMTELLSGRTATFDLAQALPISPQDFILPVTHNSPYILAARNVKTFENRTRTEAARPVSQVAQAPAAIPDTLNDEGDSNWTPPPSQPITLPESKWQKAKRWIKKSWRRIKDEFN